MEDTCISWKLCSCAYGILRAMEKNYRIMSRVDSYIGLYIDEILVDILETSKDFILGGNIEGAAEVQKG